MLVAWQWAFSPEACLSDCCNLRGGYPLMDGKILKWEYSRKGIIKFLVPADWSVLLVLLFMVIILELREGFYRKVLYQVFPSSIKYLAVYKVEIQGFFCECDVLRPSRWTNLNLSLSKKLIEYKNWWNVSFLVSHWGSISCYCIFCQLGTVLNIWLQIGNENFEIHSIFINFTFIHDAICLALKGLDLTKLQLGWRMNTNLLHLNIPYMYL